MYQNYRVLAINPLTEEPIEVLGQTLTKREIEEAIFVKVPKHTSSENMGAIQRALSKELSKITKKRIFIVPEGMEICVGVIGNEYGKEE